MPPLLESSSHTPESLGKVLLRTFFHILTGISFIVSAILGLFFLILFYFGQDLPDVRTLRTYTPITSNRIYMNGSEVWQDYAKEHRFFTHIDHIPPHVIHAFLTAEDKNFFVHNGLDLFGIFRAMVKNTIKGKWSARPAGASTITQQVVKNIFFSHAKSYKRKIQEALMAVQLEQAFPKKKILEIYLNQIYFGNRCYGITAAAERYFGKILKELSISEAAFLASLPKAPETYQPRKKPALAKARRDWVLRRMFDAGYISSCAYLKALHQPIISMDRKHQCAVYADYFLEEVRRTLLFKVGQTSYDRGGHHVWTTIDPMIQRMAGEALQEGLENYDKQQGYRGPLGNVWSNASQKHYVRALITQSFHKDAQSTDFFQKISQPPSLSLFFSRAPESKTSLKQKWMQPPRDVYSLARQAIQAYKARTARLPYDMEVAVVVDEKPDHFVLYTAPGSAAVLLKETMQWAYVCTHPAHQACTASERAPLHKGDIILVRPSQPKHVKAEKKAECVPRTFQLAQIPEATGSVVVMEPDTGHVLALSGGYDFASNNYNAATQARRQTGSAFKPFVYLTALERGFKPESKIMDSPLSIPLGFRTKDGRTTYAPRNYSRQYYGMTSLENGLVYSRNVMTVRLAMYVGMRHIQKLVEKIGLHKNLPRQLAMVLGAFEATPLQLTAAYAAIANGGYVVEPTLVTRIENSQGRDIYVHQYPTDHELQDLDFAEDSPPNEVSDSALSQPPPDKNLRIAKKDHVASLQRMLQEVVERGTARRSVGIIAQKYQVSLCGKTGTTNDYKDAWFMGFSKHLPHNSDVVVGVFVGRPDARSLGDKQSGARVAAPIAASFFDAYLAHLARFETNTS